MRIIDADALIDRLDYCVKEGMGSTIAFTFKHMVDDAPTIEPKQGGWLEKIVDDVKITVCSNCDKEPTFTHYYGSCGNYSLSDFCPNCGAQMKGADDE